MIVFYLSDNASIIFNLNVNHNRCKKSYFVNLFIVIEFYMINVAQECGRMWNAASDSEKQVLRLFVSNLLSKKTF